MTIASIPISPFEGFGIKNEAKEASREAIHEAIDGWIDEVIEMKKGAGLRAGALRDFYDKNYIIYAHVRKSSELNSGIATKRYYG